MFHDDWRWGLALQQCLSRSSGVLYRAKVAGVRVEGQLADLMTKPLAASIFHPLASFMIA